MTLTEAHVWLVDVDDEDEVARAAAVLPESDLVRLAASVVPDRHRRLGAQVALRVLAAEATGVSPVRLRLHRGRHGKPLLTDSPHVHVNLSHSGPFAAVAVTAAGPVGVDVEVPRPVGDPGGLARTMMSDAEYARWRALDEPAASEALFRHWTYKEAVLKALGLGLAGGLRSVVTTADAAGLPVLSHLPAGAGPVARWTLRDLFRGRGRPGAAPGPAPLPAAVAVAAPDVAVHFHRVRLAELVSPRVRRAAVRPPVAQLAGRPLGGARPRSPRSRKERAHVSHRAGGLPGQKSPAAAGAPTTTLFVVPHAGGSGGYYRSWSRWLPGTVDLVPLDLPGHATRMSEPLITEWDPLADDLTERVARRLRPDGERYVLAGHSLGALLAFEMARRMTAAGAPPAALLVSGRNGPTAGLSHRPIHALPDAQFLEVLERLGGSPSGVLNDADLMRIYLPLLRADVRLAETYGRRPGPPLRVPIAAFAGRFDRMTDDRGLIAWNRETTETFELSVVDGGHFFHDVPAFATAVRGCLERFASLPDAAPVPAAARAEPPAADVLQPAVPHR
ncbi:alpha/beta fold hydrolase [Streptomyces sp. URMC 129]|uniref:alpha/beta fold hydrolase n=1 Tax=Streptomyces sp. URMC 129 TaxID=3423407 RepID=UPI003F1C8E04